MAVMLLAGTNCGYRTGRVYSNRTTTICAASVRHDPQGFSENDNPGQLGVLEHVFLQLTQRMTEFEQEITLHKFPLQFAEKLVFC